MPSEHFHCFIPSIEKSKIFLPGKRRKQQVNYLWHKYVEEDYTSQTTPGKPLLLTKQNQCHQPQGEEIWINQKGEAGRINQGSEHSSKLRTGIRYVILWIDWFPKNNFNVAQ